MKPPTNHRAAALLATAAAIASCAAPSDNNPDMTPPKSKRAPRIYEIEPGAHHPPPFFTAELNTGRTTVTILMEFPHPGWSYILEHERTTSEAHEFYFTIYRPDPRAYYPMVTKQETETYDLHDAPTAVIYARTIEHDLSDAEKPYRFAEDAR